MEKIRPLNYFIIVVVMFMGASCKKNEISYEPTTGVLKGQLQLSDKRVYNCEIDQTNLIIQNSVDSLVFGTSVDVLKNLKLIFTGTIGSELFIDGKKVVSGETVIDLSNGEVILESRYGSVVKNYKTKVFVESLDHSETSGSKINGDILQTGFAQSAYTSGAAYFKGKLYLLNSRYPNGTSTTGTAYYQLFSSSDNGASWELVETNPNVIGGFGASLCVLGDRMFVIGGMRLWGVDENGINRETSVAWKMLSTTDGKNFTDCTVGQVGQPSGRGFAEVTVHNGALYVRRGKMFGFGMIQNLSQTTIFKTTDGTNWTTIIPNDINSTNKNDAAFYSFNGKLWIQGGFFNLFTGQEGLRPTLYSSSDDGITWVKETPILVGDANLARFGHKVISHNGVAYMMFGETLNANNERVSTGSILRSTDGITWEPLDANLQLSGACSGRIYPNLINGADDLFYVIGGFKESAGNYLVNGVTMNVLYDVWTKRIK